MQLYSEVVGTIIHSHNALPTKLLLRVNLRSIGSNIEDIISGG